MSEDATEEEPEHTIPDLQRPEFNNRAEELAWEEFAKGGSLAAMGRAANRSSTMASKYVKKWRKEFGEEYGMDARRAAATRQTEMARAARDAKWAEIRMEEAENISQLGQRIRRHIEKLTPKVGVSKVNRGKGGNQEPVVVPGVKAIEVKYLVESIEKLYAMADKMDGNVYQVPSGNGAEPEFTGDEEDAVQNLLEAGSGPPSDLLKAMDSIRKGFIEDVVEVESREKKSA